MSGLVGIKADKDIATIIKNRGRLLWLDVLRGFAILLVILFHFTFRYEEKYPLNAFGEGLIFRVSFGWIGVHLFFMISGFIIYLTIQNKKNSIDFLAARLSRLMPPYWTAILLILFLEYIHAHVFGVPNRNDWLVTLFNMAMIQDVAHVRMLDGSFWSLLVEIDFYFLFAILWSKLNMKREGLFLVSYAILYAFAFIHYYIHPIPLGDYFGYFLIFWVGIAACKVQNEKMCIWKYILIVILTSVSTLGFYKDGVELLVGIPVFSILMVVGQGMSEKYPKAICVLSPIARLGRISYSYYLIHQPVGYLVLGVLAGWVFNYNIAVALASVVCFGVAWVGFLFIERLDKPIAAYVMRTIE